MATAAIVHAESACLNTAVSHLITVILIALEEELRSSVVSDCLRLIADPGQLPHDGDEHELKRKRPDEFVKLVDEDEEAVVQLCTFVVARIDSVRERRIHQVKDQVKYEKTVEDNRQFFTAISFDMAKLTEQSLLVEDHIDQVNVHAQKNKESNSFHSQFLL